MTVISDARKALATAQASLLADMYWLQGRTKDSIGGRDRALLRRWVLGFAGNICTICGLTGDPDANPRDRNYLHLGHLISAETIALATHTDIYSDSGAKGGYRAGNLSCQHKGCNTDKGTATITPAMLKRPDLVPLDLPEPNTLRTARKHATQG